MKYLYMLFVLVLLGYGCAENYYDENGFGYISGDVKSIETGLTIEDVEISTNPTSTITYSDSLGKYVLEQVPLGEVTVKFSADGFISQSKSVQIFAQDTTQLHILMQSDNRFNSSPEIPEFLYPEDGSESLSPDSIKLSWLSMDSNNDTLFYTLKVYDQNLDYNETLLNQSTDTTYTITDLNYNKLYFWQISVTDKKNDVVNGPVWSFRTQDFPDLPFMYVSKSTSGIYQVYRSNMEKTIQITEGGNNKLRPLMNNDQTKIAYITTDQFEPHLFVMDVFGDNPMKVSDVPLQSTFTQELSFDWSRDDAGLYYPSKNKLIYINESGSGSNAVLTLNNNVTILKCSVSPVSNKVALVISNDLTNESIIGDANLDNGQIDTVFVSSGGRLGGLDYSASGKELLYTYDVEDVALPNGRMLDARIFLYNFDTDTHTDISINGFSQDDKEDGTNDIDPRFSPNNGKVICINRSNDNFEEGKVMTLDTDGLNREIIAEKGLMPDWN